MFGKDHRALSFKRKPLLNWNQNKNFNTEKALENIRRSKLARSYTIIVKRASRKQSPKINARF